MTPSVLEATGADIPQAARVLASAFEEYPWTRWTIPAEEYSERLEALQAIYLRHALDHGIVLIERDGHGVAAFLAPGAPVPSEADQARIAVLMGDRLAALVATGLPEHPAGAWELATIGVDPARWGQGVASSLLSDGLRRLDAVGATTVLETSDPRNVTLYSRHGFAVEVTTNIPSGPVVHTMRRPAQHT
ncbi:ribosomal protein S18 acetylase RimI-like enzyme [Micrococcus cohnii]|uniref:Ribosomal protein S18 acetylase RimI-like enzyme n=1 Tax=Micrococcus cohnii TaxID=993416 RepID=A0A7W7GM78_9MICC|nr:GNAT family N-acetyltransferase [Micrococcus cohnii]MBB4734706.1 ribosomal protein S18 acetylase RimI-like enzyme [Micrococcus cohnii]